jgi:hypothetical protein
LGNMVHGERTIFDQYLHAIGAAKEAIYIENQAIPIPPVADAIEEALKFPEFEAQQQLRVPPGTGNRQLIVGPDATLSAGHGL